MILLTGDHETASRSAAQASTILRTACQSCSVRLICTLYTVTRFHSVTGRRLCILAKGPDCVQRGSDRDKLANDLRWTAKEASAPPGSWRCSRPALCRTLYLCTKQDLCTAQRRAARTPHVCCPFWHLKCCRCCGRM